MVVVRSYYRWMLEVEENATLVLETSVPYSPESPTPVANTMRDTRRVLAIVTHIDGAFKEPSAIEDDS